MNSITKPNGALELLHQRTSIPAKYLGEPAPSGDQLQAIFKAAVTAPDHAALRPWRFVVVQGDARKRLGDVFAEAIVRRDPDTSDDQIERQRNKPMRSPLLVAVIATITPNNPKVPVFEQLLSAGVAAEHIQLAAQSMGYGSVWVTGPNATDTHVKAALNLGEHDQIAGFIHLGTPTIPPPAVKRPDPSQFVDHWAGPA